MANNEISLLKDVVLPLTSVGIGAFLGAFLAYLNERNNKKDDQLELDIAHAKKILFVLGEQFNSALNYQHKFLDPNRNDEFRHLIAPNSFSSDVQYQSLNIEDLMFLLRHGKEQLAYTISVENSRFHALVDTINRWVKFHNTELQPHFSQLASINPAITPQEINDQLGERFLAISQTTSNAMYQHTDLFVGSNPALAVNCKDTFKELFPKAAFKVVIHPQE